MTFNFFGREFKPRDPKYMSWGVNIDTDSRSPITHSSKLDFLEFIELFKSFSLWFRKDLKDIFDQIATTTPAIERKMPKKIADQKADAKQSGKKCHIISATACARLIYLTSDYMLYNVTSGLQERGR